MHLKSLYPELPVIPPINVHNLVFRRPDQKEWKNYTLHIDGKTGQRRSFREFYERVIDGATALAASASEQGLGINAEDGEIVGIMSENCMDYITLVHSCLAITTPFALLSSYYTQFELTHALRLSKATRLFVQAKFLTLAQRAAKEVGLPDDRIYLLEGPTIKGRQSFEDLIHRIKKNFTPRISVRDAGTNTLAYLIFSSGTSGLPKAVMISQGNLISAILQTIVAGGEEEKVAPFPTYQTPESNPITLAFLPLHHSYALHIFCFRLFLRPYTLVLLPRWNLDTVLKVIPKYRVTHLLMVPSIIHQLVNSPKSKKADLSSLTFLGSGSAYLPESLAQKALGLAPQGAAFNEGYGMSEGTITITSKPINEGVLEGRAKIIPGSAGILYPGLEARILRSDGSDAEYNEPGELWVKGPTIALGYWNNEKANRETFVDGWLKTGDVFVVDQDGVFYFQDRQKDTLKVSGMQISPLEIENALLAHPDKLLIDASVAGVSGGRTSDEKYPRAWVVLSEKGNKMGATSVITSLEKWIAESLSKYKRLRGGIEVVSEIPKSPTGKVLRRVLQDEYDQRLRKSNVKL